MLYELRVKPPEFCAPIIARHLIAAPDWTTAMRRAEVIYDYSHLPFWDRPYLMLDPHQDYPLIDCPDGLPFDFDRSPS